MNSIFGEDGVDDILGDNLYEGHELPNGNEHEHLFGENEAENGEEGDNADGAAIKVEPKKRLVRNPRPRLTAEILKGPRGIHTIEDYFKDIKYKGKGYERSDLDEVMRRLKHWAHRMYPTYTFDDVLTQIENLGKKKPLQVHMSRYRMGLLESEKITPLEDENDNEEENPEVEEPFDEFDALLGEQIAISKLAPRTPASANRNMTLHTPMTNRTSYSTSSFVHGNAMASTPHSGLHNLDESVLAQPLPPSQPETPSQSASQLNADQMARIAENRRIAQERLKAKRLQQQSEEGQSNEIEVQNLNETSN